jgi:hypothetical protein
MIDLEQFENIPSALVDSGVKVRLTAVEHLNKLHWPSFAATGVSRVGVVAIYTV